AGFAQSKSTGVMALNNGIPITANFTLNSNTSTVTLVLTGPSDRWFGLGIGVADGFNMQNGDALVYTTALSHRNFIGFTAPAVDATESWTTVSNTVVGTVRTLTLTRSLTNTDPNDFQMPYATTNSISIGGARALSQTTNLGSHGNGGFATATFTTLDVEDFSLNASAVYPNPSTGNFSVKSKTTLDRINIYSQTGAFMKTVEGDLGANQLEINAEELPKGVYLIELQNASDKSWKKIIIN
ncbi:T9SS type A sorting domain-containing protein, partial [Microcoleus sp. F8-C3]